MRVRKSAALVAAAIAVAIACGALGIQPAGAAGGGGSQVSSHLLALSNLPAGWSATHSTTGGGGVDSNRCIEKFRTPTKHEHKASASFKDGTTTFLFESLATGPGALGSLQALNRAVKHCRSVTVTQGATKLHLAISQISFPKITKTSVAINMTATATHLTVGVDFVTFHAGNYDGFVGYGGLGTPEVTTMETFVKAAVAKAQGKKASTVPKSQGVGATQDAKSETGASYTVQLVQVIDPATSATPTFTTPAAGNRYVATEFTITDTGQKPLSDDANSDTTLVGNNNQTYRSGFASISGCTNFNTGTFALQPGQSATGCVAFTVPASVAVAKVEWSPSSGFSSNFVFWTVH